MTIPRYSPSVSPLPSPLPSRCILRLPLSFDPVEGLGAALRIASEREPGVVWQPESVNQDRDAWVLTLAVDPDDAPELQHVSLGLDVKPSDGPKVAAHMLMQGGRHLLTFDPYLHKATSARLLPFVAKLREQLAAYLRLDPWEIQIALRWKASSDGLGPWEISTLTATAPLTVSPDKRAQVWLDLARDLIPAVRGTNWWCQDLPQENKVILRRAEDPLGSIGAYPWDAAISVNAVPFGVDVESQPVTIGLIERNLLMGGSPGAGKSGGATSILCGVSRLEHVAIIGIDPKRVELAGWRPRMSYVATQDSDISRTLAAVVEEMESRYEYLADAGKKKITEEMLTDELPLIVIFIDELADCVSIGVTKEEKEQDLTRATRIRRLIAKGRAAGICVETMTQKSSSDIIPTSLRDLIQLRVSFATTTAAMTDTILGSGSSQNGGLSHEIPSELKGVCYLINEEDRKPIRCRAYWVPDEEVATHAAATAHLRVDLPWLTATEPTFSPEDGPPPAPRRSAVSPAPPVSPAVEVSLADTEPVDEPEGVADDPWA
jgi:hypothetical protein